MSRAFTKEDDDTEAIAMIGERPVSAHRNLVTPEGLKQIDAEIARLREEFSQAEKTAERVAVATHLRDLSHELDCDVLICGEKSADKDVVAGLCRDAGMRGINAGALANAVVAEGLTAVLLGINVRHKISGAGIRITGLPEEQAVGQ